MRVKRENIEKFPPWSYHTFILPFFAQVKDGANLRPATFVSAASELAENRPSKDGKSFGTIKLSSEWKPISWFTDDTHLVDTPPTNMVENMDGCDVMKLYNAFQYFTDPARDLVFGRSGRGIPPLVKHFDLRPGPHGESLRDLKSKYVIECSKGEQTWTYELDLVRVRLITYSTFVSMLVLETENWTDHHSQEDIKRINEFGRHVCFPFLRTFDNESPAAKGHPSVADSITIRGVPGLAPEAEKTDECEADFTFMQPSWRTDLSFRHLMVPLKQLLSIWSFRQAVSSRDSVDDQKYLVNPVMDDRMYVCCLYRNEVFSQRLHMKDSEGYLIASTKDSDVVDDFYSFAFVDAEDSSCRSSTMRRDIVKAALYDRWIDYGTVYAMSDHSFMCVTGGNWDATEALIIKPFSNMYLEMVIMTLAQKASILHMSSEAAKLADDFSGISFDSKKSIDAQFSSISKLQQQNARVQNQVVLSEVTTQEQGREMFTKMRSQLGIAESNAELTEQVQYLYAMTATVDQERRAKAEQTRNTLFNTFAFVIGLIAVASAVVDVFSFNRKWMYWLGGSLLALAVIILVLFVAIPFFRRLKRRRTS